MEELTVSCFLLFCSYYTVIFRHLDHRRFRLVRYDRPHRLLDSLVAGECWLRVREVPGSIPSQGQRLPKMLQK